MTSGSASLVCCASTGNKKKQTQNTVNDREVLNMPTLLSILMGACERYPLTAQEFGLFALQEKVPEKVFRAGPDRPIDTQRFQGWLRQRNSSAA
jgi:hypothetical protein